MKVVPISVAMTRVDGTDLDVVNAARVSFDKLVWDITDREEKLIAYLAHHKHWTPFGHVGAQFRIKAPIFIARQLVKHQVGLVWNEVSRRYVSSEPEFFLPTKWRCAAANVKQGSSKQEFSANTWQIREVLESTLSLYTGLIEGGCCPEQARMVLPLNTMTEWIWTGSLAAWARVCKLRLDLHAQEEVRDVATLINEQLKIAFPVSWKALMEYY